MASKPYALSLRPVALAVSLLLASQAHAVGNGNIASGTGNIDKNGNTTTVNQTSDKLIVNWDNMDVAKGDTLTFAQKNAQASVLNRIASADPTTILGALNANGRVFIVNPNGVLIGNGAAINVGSLVASSLNISDADFNADNLNFAGGGNGNVINQGTINAAESVGLIGSKKVENTGTIKAKNGNVTLASGDAISLTFSGSNLQAKLTQGSLEALVNNGGVIATQNGDIVLTAWARDALTRSVINNTGVLEATALPGATATAGHIQLISQGNGAVNVGGTVKSAMPAYTGSWTVGEKGAIYVQGRGINILDNAKLDAQNQKITLSTTPEEGAAGYVKFGKAEITAERLKIGADNILTSANQANLPTINAVTVLDITPDNRGLLLGGRSLDDAEADKFHDGKRSVSTDFIKAASKHELAVEKDGGAGDVVINDKLDIGHLSISAGYSNILINHEITGRTFDAVTDGDIEQAANARIALANEAYLDGHNVNQRADISADNEVALKAKQSLIQAKDTLTKSNRRVLYDGNNVTLSGVTRAAHVWIASDNASLDGDITAQEQLRIMTHGKVSTTERAVLKAKNAYLAGRYGSGAVYGSFDLTRGDIAFDDAVIKAKSADIALNSDSTITAETKEYLRVRGKKNLTLNGISTGGYLDASAAEDLNVGWVKSRNGDVTLHGKNVKSVLGVSDARYSFSFNSLLGEESLIDAAGRVMVTADENVTLGDISANQVEVKAKGGFLKTGLVTSSADAYLEGKSGIELGQRAKIAKNLTLVSGGDVTQSEGVEVGGDLTYQLAETSKVTGNAAKPNDVKGKTSELRPKAAEPKADETPKADATPKAKETPKAEETPKAKEPTQAEIQRTKEVERQKKIDALPWWLRPFAWLFGL
jgi:filamentous hemagglutinin family protein